MSENLYAGPNAELQSKAGVLGGLGTLSRPILEELLKQAKILRFLAFLQGLGGLIYVLLGVTGLFSDEPVTGFMMFLIALGLFQLFLSFELMRLKGWTRIPAQVIFFFSLFGFPIGTLAGIFGLRAIKKLDSLFKDPELSYAVLKAAATR